MGADLSATMIAISELKFCSSLSLLAILMKCVTILARVSSFVHLRISFCAQKVVCKLRIVASISNLNTPTLSYLIEALGELHYIGRLLQLVPRVPLAADQLIGLNFLKERQVNQRELAL